MLMRLVESVDVQCRWHSPVVAGEREREEGAGHLILCFDSGIERKEGRAETDSYQRANIQSG